MDQFGDYRQVISMASPPLEAFGGPDVTPGLARVANDAMAELVIRYPDRFAGFIACLPMNHPAEAERELHRALRDLGARGVQIFSNVNGLPLDRDEFRFLFAVMSAYDLPIWLHPARGSNFPDYLTEDRSLYEIWWTLGWPYETSVAMARLAFSGQAENSAAANAAGNAGQALQAAEALANATQDQFAHVRAGRIIGLSASVMGPQFAFLLTRGLIDRTACGSRKKRFASMRGDWTMDTWLERTFRYPSKASVSKTVSLRRAFENALSSAAGLGISSTSEIRTKSFGSASNNPSMMA
jgi:hypothetical protein